MAWKPCTVRLALFILAAAPWLFTVAGELPNDANTILLLRFDGTCQGFSCFLDLFG